MSDQKQPTIKERSEILRKEFTEKWAPEVAMGAYKGFTPERVLSATLQAGVFNPMIFLCSKPSIFLAVMKCARWGLDIGDGVHLVPYKIKGVLTCTAIPDYRGLKALAIRQRIVRHMDEAVVWAGDEFDYSLGSPQWLKHKPCGVSERGLIRGAYTVALLPGGIERFHYMPVEDLEVRRMHSQKWSREKVGNMPAWWAKKTVVIDYLSKQPKGGALSEAIDSDRVDDGEFIAMRGVIAPPAAAPAPAPEQEAPAPAQLGDGALSSIDEGEFLGGEPSEAEIAALAEHDRRAAAQSGDR